VRCRLQSQRYGRSEWRDPVYAAVQGLAIVPGLWKRARLPAKSIMSGVVARIEIAALAALALFFGGVLATKLTMTPCSGAVFLFDPQKCSITCFKVTGSKYRPVPTCHSRVRHGFQRLQLTMMVS